MRYLINLLLFYVGSLSYEFFNGENYIDLLLQLYWVAIGVLLAWITRIQSRAALGCGRSNYENLKSTYKDLSDVERARVDHKFHDHS